MDSIKLIDIYADWCNPCKVQSKIVNNIEKKYPDLVVEKLDADNPDNQDFIAEHHVRNLPALFLFKDKELVWKTAGLTTQTQIETELEKYKQ